MTTATADRLEAWFAKLEKLEEPKRTQMMKWVKQELAREKSLATHRHVADLAASLDPAFVKTPANTLIAEAIEETIDTRRGRLLITMPPQEGKTTLGPVHGTVRALQKHPEWRVMLACYSSTLAEESSIAARAIIAKHGSDAVDPLTQMEGTDELGLALAYDKAAAAAWRIRGHRGGMVAVGLSGTISGRPADCVSGDTHILTEYGNTTAAAAYERGDQWILGYDHDAEAAVWRRVEARRRIDGRDTVEVVTESDRVLTCTPDHRVYTSGGYTAAGDLRVREGLVTIESACGVSLRDSVGDRQGRHREGDAPRTKSVLLAGMRETSTLGQESNPQVPVRWPDTAISEADMLGRMPARATVPELDIEGLPPVRERVSAEVAPHTVLQPRLCESDAFAADDRRRELTPQDGRQLREVVPVDAADHPGTGREPLRGMRRDATADRLHLARPRKDTLATGYSPHRREHQKQPAREPDHSLRDLPHDPPQVGSDAVAVVRPSGGGPQPVYDFQVEGTRNFFADGVLVHNCLIIDDPIKGMEASNSPTIKKHVIEGFQGDLTTRLSAGAPIILIQTRWAVDDLAGWILEREAKLPPEKRRWRHINIPAQAEEGLYDSLVREPGVWLESARGRTASDWEETRNDVGSRVWASLYQGSPSPLEGGLIKKQWLNDHRLTLPPANPEWTVVGVDPCDSGRGDDAGVVAASIGTDGRVAMIADRSAPMTSDKWAKTAVELAIEVGASKIVVESFAARETYRQVLDGAITDANPPHPIEIVSWPPIGSGRGGGDSMVRSTALLAQLENGKTCLVGHFPTWEAKATNWNAGQHQPDGVAALTVAHDELVHSAGLEWDIAVPFETGREEIDMSDWMQRNI